MVSRRDFLSTTGALAGVPCLAGLPRLSAEDVKSTPKIAAVREEIEPLTRLIETTPRDELLDKVAARIRKGASYKEVLAALFLAAVRNVQPRPSVGFKFHAVLVVNSAHLASMASPESDRWLPIFWTLDYVKTRQLEEERKSGWKLPPVKGDLPKPHKAKAQLVQALDAWDAESADAATAALVRNAGANEVFELLFRYGSRDYRSIGHKAIYTANAYRTLGVIGWEHSEPIVRSLVYAILNHTGERNPAKTDVEADRPYRGNLERVKSIRKDWRSGKMDAGATREMIATLREGTSDEACANAVKLLNKGVSPQSIWDAVFLGAGELLMQQPGIIGLHGLTTANAIHYAWRTAGSDENRKLLLLQNCAFQPLFRKSASRRGRISKKTLSELEAVKMDDQKSPVAEILADINKNRTRAAGKVRGYLQSGGKPKSLIDGARRMIFYKGNDAHDYKFSSAVLEDYYNISPAFRETFLATSVFNLTGSGDRENSIVRRTRAAFGKK